MRIKEMFKKVTKKLKEKKGATMFEYIIIIAIVSIIAVKVLPPLMNSISTKADDSVKKVDGVEAVFTKPAP